MRMIIKIPLIVVLLILSCALCIDNGLGLTPQMGWNSWNHFGCKINETLIKTTADQLVSLKLASKGYVYLNLDDCWQISRNTTTK
jgi:alpha-galactosidase